MKENVQLISWSIEFATFIVASLIVWLVWRTGKKDSEKRKAEQDFSAKDVK